MKVAHAGLAVLVAVTMFSLTVSTLDALFPAEWKRKSGQGYSIAVALPNWRMGADGRVVNRLNPEKVIHVFRPVRASSKKFRNRLSPDSGWSKAFDQGDRIFYARKTERTVEFSSWANEVMISGVVHDENYHWNNRHPSFEEITQMISSVRPLDHPGSSAQ